MLHKEQKKLPIKLKSVQTMVIKKVKERQQKKQERQQKKQEKKQLDFITKKIQKRKPIQFFLLRVDLVVVRIKRWI